MKYGIIRVAAATPETRVADCSFNTEQIISLLNQAHQQNVEIIVFPELSITSYTCGDLFHQSTLLNEAEYYLSKILHHSQQLSLTAIVGVPVRCSNRLFNAGIVIQHGHILGVVPKSYLPNHNEFYEQRWFSSAFDSEEKEISLCGESVPFGNLLLFKASESNVSFAIEICEDLWTPIPPSSYHCMKGAQLIFNLSASNELIGKQHYRRNLISQQSARTNSAYIYTSAGCGESSTDTVYGGSAFIAENGYILAQNERFSLDSGLIIADVDTERLSHDRYNNSAFSDHSSFPTSYNGYKTIFFNCSSDNYTTLLRPITAYPFVPRDKEISERCQEIFSIQTSGLAKRLLHTHSEYVVIGISGGLDSTLALLACAKAFDRIALPRKNITGITMPGFGTTGRTYNNALQLMKSLGISIREIDIKAAVELHFSDIGHETDVTDVTYENSQARERTQILMDVANQLNGLVIGTGDLSELALGWATYNGDHMSMYGVNSGIPKTLVRYLVRWAADYQVDNETRDTLLDILDTPVSPELLPATGNGEISQKTEDIVGPYELHDFYLYYMIRFGFSPTKIFILAKQAFEKLYSPEIIAKWLKVFIRRFFSQQFKRSCMPDGPKVGSINLSPRGDWRMPSDASLRLWIKEAENLPL